MPSSLPGELASPEGTLPTPYPARSPNIHTLYTSSLARVSIDLISLLPEMQMLILSPLHTGLTNHHVQSLSALALSLDGSPFLSLHIHTHTHTHTQHTRTHCVHTHI